MSSDTPGTIPGLDQHVGEPFLNDMKPVTLTNFKKETITMPPEQLSYSRSVSKFQKIATLGEGRFGIVYKAKDVTTNEVFILKRVTLKDMSDRSYQEEFFREVTSLQLLKHENILNLREIVCGKNSECIYLVTEDCSFVLSKVIYGVPSPYLQHPQIKNIMTQLLMGLDYIHHHYIIHRNLCPATIHFTENGTLKISNFDFSRKITSGNLTPQKGNNSYRPPEIVFGAKKYGTPVDIWAAGCLFAEMIRQSVLFQGEKDFDIINQFIDILGTPTEIDWPEMATLPVPYHYSLRKQVYNRIRSTFYNQTLETCQFLTQLLQYNPAKRLTAVQCLMHPYFAEYPRACVKELIMPLLKASLQQL